MMNDDLRNVHRALFCSLAVSSTLIFCTGAAAQSAESSGPAQIDEIIVTAEKREQNVQNVPASVSVIGAASLEARGIVDLRGLTNLLPMAQLNMETATTQIFIRGIGQTSDADTNSPAVAVNIDGVYTPRYALSASLFDVSQIEVLSGPQGTLYGRNAAGGAVNVMTNLPKNHFESNGFLEVGNYNFVHIFDVINIPVTNELRLRAAIDSNQRNGYMTNGQDDQDSIAGRVVGLYEPGESFSVILRAEFQDIGGNGSSGILTPFLNPENPWYQPTTRGEHFFNKEKVYKANAEFKYELGGPQNIGLTLISAYTQYDFHFKIPIGQPVMYFRDPGVPGNPLTGFSAALDAHDLGRQVTNEFRVNGGTDELKWVLGLYQLHFRASGPGLASFDIDNPAVFSGGSAQPYVFTTGGGASDDVVTNDAYAGFGEMTYSVSRHLRLTAGLRYSHDEDRTHGISQALVPVANFALPPNAYNLGLSAHRVDWKVGVEADLSAASMAYAGVQTGFIDGGFNIDSVTSNASTFRPETLLAYTAGIKNRFFDNALRLNAEAFYYRYNDLQVSAYDVSNGANDLYNVPRSTIYGLQVETLYRVFAHTTFDANVGFLHAVINSAILPPAAVYSCGVPGAIPADLCSPNSLINYKGQSLPNSPAVSASAGLTQEWEIGTSGTIEGRVATHYEGATWGIFAHLEGLQKPAYTKTDLSLTYHAQNSRWNVGVWVKNIENTATYVSPATTNVYGLQAWFLSPPRTFGLRVGYQIE